MTSEIERLNRQLDSKQKALYLQRQRLLGSRLAEPPVIWVAGGLAVGFLAGRKGIAGSARTLRRSYRLLTVLGGLSAGDTFFE